MSNQEEISATEKFMNNISIVFSMYRTEQISKCVKRGMLYRAKSGYAISRPPLGYSKTEMAGLFKINRQGKALRELLKKLANGETNIESATINIALMFYGSNVIKSWSTTRTKHQMADPYYAGYTIYKGQLYKGLHEPLITYKEYKRLLALLKNQNCSNSLKPIEKSIFNNYNDNMSRKNK